MVLINPELRRNIWLDFSVHRLVLTPVVIGLITYFFYLMGSHQSGAGAAFNLGWFFLFLWGTKSASESVIEEVNNNTWDFQRQSMITPWSMTWGKLFGSTLFSWYGALISFVLYSSLTADPISQKIFLISLGGLFTQALALLFSLQGLSHAPREHTHRTFKYFLCALVLGAFVTQACFQAIKNDALQIVWHDMSYQASTFTVSSLMLFLGWAVLGLSRAFSKELQYQNLPWVWLLFNLFCMYYFSGFISFDLSSLANTNLESNLTTWKNMEVLLAQAPYYIAFFVAQLLTYIALFTDTLNTVRYQRLLARFTHKDLLEAVQQIPWWMISFVLTILSGIVAYFGAQFSQELLAHFSPGIFILTSILFIQRDILLVHYFYFNKAPKRALSTATLYLFILYFLIPMLLGALHLTSLLPIFIPSWGQDTLIALLSTIGQIIFLGILCRKKFLMLK